MTAHYAPRTRTLAANVILDAAVADARARLAGPGDPAQYYAANAATLLLAISAVELIEGGRS